VPLGWFLAVPRKSHKPFGNYPKPQLRDKRVLTAESTPSSVWQVQVASSSCKLGAGWDVEMETERTHTPSDPWALVVFARLGGQIKLRHSLPTN